MKHYEAAFIITPELSEDEAKAKMNELITKIQEVGGTLELSLNQRSPIKRRLSYAIQKKEIAYLASVYFTLEDIKRIKEIKETLDKDKVILRSLIVIHKEQKKEEIPNLPRRKEESKDEDSKEAVSEKETVKEETSSEVEEEVKEDKKENSKADLQDVDKKLDEILE
jgi:ribosomal protein S6